MPLIQWTMQNLNVVKVEGVVAGGTADVAMIMFGMATGGAVVGGVFTDNIIISEISPGGVVVGGSALEDVFITGQGGVIVGGSADLGTPISVEVASGGVVVGGSADLGTNHIFDEKGSGGAVVGGSATVTVGVEEPCDKYLLPHHPKPSTANYSPQNIAPLIEFFTPIVAGVLGMNLDKCDVTFRYENNTPCKYNDDIFVQHPTCLGLPYSPPGANPCSLSGAKSDELKKYEEYAKKSDRLKKYMEDSPAKIEYFHDLCFS